MRKHSLNRSKEGNDFKCFWLLLELSASLVRYFPLVIVIERATKKQINKGRSVAFQIITGRDRIREIKHLVRENDDTKYVFFSFFCLTSMTESFLKFRKANEIYLNLLFASNSFSSSIYTLYDNSLSWFTWDNFQFLESKCDTVFSELTSCLKCCQQNCKFERPYCLLLIWTLHRFHNVVFFCEISMEDVNVT